MRDDHYDYMFNVVLTGTACVGKSSLLSRFSKNEFSLDTRSTVGVEFQTRTINIDGKIIKAQIWDTAGREIYPAVASAYYRGADCVLIVYDITRANTFKPVELWLALVRHHTDQDVVVMMVGNKADQINLRAVKTEDAKAFAERENIGLFMETSALDTLNVENAFVKMLTERYHVVRKKEQNKDDAENEMVKVKPKEESSNVGGGDQDVGVKMISRENRRYSQFNGPITNIEPPRLSGDNFSIWKNRMIGYLNFVDYKLLETIKEGWHTPHVSEQSKWSDEDKQKVALDYKAMHLLSMSLPDDIYGCVMNSESAKEMWDRIIVLFEGSDETRECRRSLLIQQYELFKCKPGESLSETYIRFSYLINELRQHGKTFDNDEMVNKFLRSLLMEWNSMCMIRQTKNLKTMSLESLYGHLLTCEMERNHDACVKERKH